MNSALVRLSLALGLLTALSPLAVACSSDSTSGAGTSNAPTPDSSTADGSVPSEQAKGDAGGSDGGEGSCAEAKHGESCSSEGQTCSTYACVQCQATPKLYMSTRQTECDCMNGKWECNAIGGPVDCSSSTPGVFDDDQCTTPHATADGGR